MKERERQSTIFQDVTLSTSFFSPQEALKVDINHEASEAFRYFGEHFTEQTLVM